MSARRTVLVAALAWLVVVAFGTTMVWVVISRAGDVTPTVAEEPVGSASGETRTPSPSTEKPKPTKAPSSDSAQRTWHGAGGYVSATCQRSAISLDGAQADVGFTVEVEDRGPERLRVHFEGQGEEGRETEVEAQCVDGVPDFTVSAEDE